MGGAAHKHFSKIGFIITFICSGFRTELTIENLYLQQTLTMHAQVACSEKGGAQGKIQQTALNVLVAVCCSVLQCVAVCCSVLQCVAVC